MVKKHHHLVSGKVLFTGEDNTRDFIELNTVVTTFDGNVTTKELGQAQQALQMRLFSMVGPKEVHDVFIIGISPLGKMTEEHFMKGALEAEAAELGAPVDG